MVAQGRALWGIQHHRFSGGGDVGLGRYRAIERELEVVPLDSLMVSWWLGLFMRLRAAVHDEEPGEPGEDSGSPG